MKAVIQRVNKAIVTVDGIEQAAISKGLLIYLGITHDDSKDDINYLVKKILGLRIFNDENGVMNLSVVDLDLEILVVSQFTLYADARKGNRPSYIAAARPEVAKKIYDDFVSTLSRKMRKACPEPVEGQKRNKPIQQGVFQAHMEVSSINDGPVTIIIESPSA
jgi:D-tyrosyl-tRNA(Tyr) deacylase